MNTGTLLFYAYATKFIFVKIEFTIHGKDSNKVFRVKCFWIYSLSPWFHNALSYVINSLSFSLSFYTSSFVYQIRPSAREDEWYSVSVKAKFMSDGVMERLGYVKEMRSHLVRPLPHTCNTLTNIYAYSKAQSRAYTWVPQQYGAHFPIYRNRRRANSLDWDKRVAVCMGQREKSSYEVNYIFRIS